MATTVAENTVRRAVVLAGGEGTRLHPFTFALPKPLVPIGETPIIEIVLAQLERAGVEHMTMAVGHMAGVIMAYMAGRKNGRMRIDFHVEDSPLGTAGALGLIQELGVRSFVMNGDLLTSMDFRVLGHRHVESGADITLAAFRKAHKIDLGVLEADSDGRLMAYHEKPSHVYLASMGIYVMEADAVALVGAGERLDLPQLVRRATLEGLKVQVHEFQGYWTDVGTPDEYAKAQEDFKDCDPIRKLMVDSGADRG